MLILYSVNMTIMSQVTKFNSVIISILLGTISTTDSWKMSYREDLPTQLASSLASMQSDRPSHSLDLATHSPDPHLNSHTVGGRVGGATVLTTS